MIVMADEQHTVTGSNSEQRDESDDSGYTNFPRCKYQCENATDQRERQVQQDNSRLLDAAELMIKQ